MLFINSKGVVWTFAALALLALASARAAPWTSTTPGGDTTVHLYFFWSLQCPHCLEARPYVEALPHQLPWLQLHSLELTQHPAHVEQYVTMARALGEEARSVPAFLFCGEMLVGYDDDATTGAYLRDALTQCHAAAVAAPEQPLQAPGTQQSITLPGLRDVHPDAWSLPALTVALAALDSFNPCAFFVLLFLLSLLVHARSRARMLAIGAIFVLCSGLVYFLFMSAWLNAFLLIGHARAVTLLAGTVAIVAAMINVKDFFRFKRDVSLSIPGAAKPGLFARMRALVNADRLPNMLAGTIVLAVLANFYELLCTAGFPMVYTRILTLRGLPAAEYYFYLALYNVVYVIPLAAIVVVFAYTLGARKLSEREGRILKLLSGTMMLELGLVLVLAPTWLDSPWIALALIAAALTTTWLVARLTRRSPLSAA